MEQINCINQSNLPFVSRQNYELGIELSLRVLIKPYFWHRKRRPVKLFLYGKAVQQEVATNIFFVIVNCSTSYKCSSAKRISTAVTIKPTLSNVKMAIISTVLSPVIMSAEGVDSTAKKDFAKHCNPAEAARLKTQLAKAGPVTALRLVHILWLEKIRPCHVSDS